MVGAVVPGVYHEDAPTEPREPGRGGEPGGTTTDDHDVHLAMDREGAHGSGSR